MSDDDRVAAIQMACDDMQTGAESMAGDAALPQGTGEFTWLKRIE